VRALPLDELSQGVDDDYVLVREAWRQRRNHQSDDQAAQSAEDVTAPVEHQVNGNRRSLRTRCSKPVRCTRESNGGMRPC